MASEGPHTPGTTSGTSWSNTGNVVSSNNSYATATISAGATTNLLTLTNFGFAIPAGATIDGIVVTQESKASANSAVSRKTWNLLNVSGAVQVSDGGLLTTSDVSIDSGSSSDLWGTAPTPAEINSSSFGVSLDYENVSGSSRTVSVDYVAITVYYTDPPQQPRVSACGASAYGQVSQRPMVTACGASVYGDTVAAGGGNSWYYRSQERAAACF